MTLPLHLTMLWESTDPHIALTKRFQFATPGDAVRWLIDTVARTYGVDVASVDRLVMSSYNLLAWLTTAEGPLIAKCCAFVMAHQRLLNAAELVVWLDQGSIPVSAPLVTKTGVVQVICDHLSLGVQRLLSGTLLDPTQLEQAHAAGVVLSRIHHALATYPRATAFASPSPVPSLPTLIENWIKQKAVTITEPDLVAGSNTLMERVRRLATAPLATQLVHGDYRAANILWHEGKIRAVLDFEEVRWGYRVNDLAWAAVHLGTRFRDWGPVSTEVHRVFLSSYAAVQPLTETEQAWLPVLLAWHSINLACSASGGPPYNVEIVDYH